MEISERLRLSSDREWLAVFHEGMFMRFYDAHLGWFCQRGRKLKVLRRDVKKLNGQTVYYGGLPQATFQEWLRLSEPVLEVQEQPWGLQLRIPDGLDIEGLLMWCAEQPLAATQLSTKAAAGLKMQEEAALNAPGPQILFELEQLILANCTPLHAMQWIARWQALTSSSVQCESDAEG